MNILHINTRYIGGGGAAYIANILHNQLSKIENVQSEFLFGRGINLGDKRAIKISDDKSVLISALSQRVLGRELNLKFDKELIEEKIKNCDIVHIHNLHGYYVDYDFIIKTIVKYSKKVVWTLHDFWILTGRCAFMFSKEDCMEWKYGCKKCNWKDIYPKTYLDRAQKEYIKKLSTLRLISKRNLIFAVPSEWEKGIIKGSVFKDYNIEVIYNSIEGIEINKSKKEIRKKWGFSLNKNIFLVVAADIKDSRKGILDLFDNIESLDKNTLILTVGEKLKSLKNEKIIQLGYIEDREDLYEIYKLVDVFINPSYAETFSLTTLEAMSVGTPTIGFNIGPIEELLQDGCGKVVPKGDFNKLIFELHNINFQKEEIEKIQINCTKRYKEKYDKSIMVNGYINLYKKLLEI